MTKQLILTVSWR